MTKIIVEVEFKDQKIADMYKAIALLSARPLGEIIGEDLESYANIYADGYRLSELWEERFYKDKPEYAHIFRK